MVSISTHIRTGRWSCCRAAAVAFRYRPMDQIIGYILTGDPTYITNHSGARQLAARIDRYDLLEDLLRACLTADETVEHSV